ncbi:MAG: chemotaxis protein CheA [bacterium]
MGIEQTVRELSESVVFVEPSDLQALASLHAKLEEIETWASETSNLKIRAVVNAAAKLIEGIILEEIPDSEAAFEVFKRTVAGLQEVLCDGRRLEMVPFPPELGLREDDRTGMASGQSYSATELSLPPFPTGLTPQVDEALFAEFLSRQIGALEEMEDLILSLEKSIDENKLRTFRGLIHTLKGESAVIGLSDVARVCHILEDRLEQNAATEMADVLLDAKDWLLRFLKSYSGSETEGPLEPVENILAKLTGTDESSIPSAVEHESATIDRPVPEPGQDFQTALSTPEEWLPRPQVAPAEKKTEPQFTALEGDPGLLSDFVTEAREHLDSADVHLLKLEATPQDEEALNAVFRAFHTIKGVAGFLALGEIQSVAHEAESLLARARKKQLTLVDSAIDVTFEAVDALKCLINQLGEALSTGTSLKSDESLHPLLERIRAVLDGRKLPEQPVQTDQTPAEEPPQVAKPPESKKPAAIPEPKPAPRTGKAGPTTATAAKPSSQQHAVTIREAIKVDAERLDHVVEMIGELVITESMVTRAIEDMGSPTPEVSRHLKQLRKITRELQEMGTSLRMIPIRSTFQKMARVARDLSKKTGKPLEFVTSGEDTELDKTVVDRIADPLVHLVRNAVDHGLEDSLEMRRQAGKPEIGRVELRAFHKGGNIYIEIEDDGRGLNRESILNKARERGLIQDGDTLSEREIFNLVFEPGFSTAKVVTDVSGRGVGMDVVRRNIMGLRGQIDIQSESGKGSVFAIRLPLTLAIIDGMVVRVGPHRYIIPTLSIVQSVQPQSQELSTILNSGEMARFQGKHVPLFRLGDLFNIEDSEQDPTKGIVVVVEEGEEVAGLLVDDLLGQQQIVIKSLGGFFQGAQGIAGGAIMSDGRVGLILDVGALVKLAN